MALRRPETKAVKTYTFERPGFANAASKIVLVLATLCPIYVVVAQLAARRTDVQYFVLFAYPIIAYWWYVVLKPVKVLQLSENGDLAFVTGLGRKTVSAGSVRAIRPLFNLSAHNFVLQHERGSELLFGDPNAVSLIAAEIQRANPTVHLHHVPHRPE